jgi:hypothetical protein
MKESFSRAIIPAKEKLEIGSQRYFINQRVSSADGFTKHLDEIGIEYMEVKYYPKAGSLPLAIRKETGSRYGNLPKNF